MNRPTSKPLTGGKRSTTHDLLRAYNLRHRGIAGTDTDISGEQCPLTFTPFAPTAGHVVQDPKSLPWKSSLPTPSDLLRTPFGKLDANHSFTQEASGETILFHVLKPGYLNPSHQGTRNKLCSVHPLVLHLA